MNRRSFIRKILASAVAPAILPSASTYKRLWRKTGELYTSGWFEAQDFETVYMFGEKSEFSSIIFPVIKEVVYPQAGFIEELVSVQPVQDRAAKAVFQLDLVHGKVARDGEIIL